MKLSTQGFEDLGGKDSVKGNRQGSLSPTESKAGPKGRTMPFEISSSEKKGWFSPALLKKNVTRFWPIWAIYTAILFFALPVEVALNGSRVDILAESLMMVMVPMGGFFGLAAAMALFSYLMSPKACQMYHALPIRREGLFLTNWVTGLCFFLVPNLAICLLTGAVMLVTRAAGAGSLALWLVMATAAPMFFFCFAVMCAMFTGHILALPIFYGILNVLVVGVCFLLDRAGSELLYNYSGMELAESILARWCTPAYQIIYLLGWTEGPLINGVTAAAGYCVALGAAFTLIAVVAYQHRQLERAEDLVSVGWVRPVFQWGFGACIGLSVGLVLYWNFFRSTGPWAYIGCVAVCAVIGAFAGRMLLKKTLRVFAEGWRSCLALGLCMLLLMAGVKVDAFGFQRWTPDPLRVGTVHIYNPRTYPNDDGRYIDVSSSDPRLIGQAVELHRTLNDKLPELQRSKEQGVEYRIDEDGYELRSGVEITFVYEMLDGSTVTRRYEEVTIDAGELSDPGSYAAKLDALVNLPEMEKKSYWRGWKEPPQDLRVSGGWISRVLPEPEETALPGEDMAEVQAVSGDVVSTESYSQRLELELDGSAARALWDAFQEDLDAGRVKRYLLHDRQRAENCYYSDITLSLSWTDIDDAGQRYTNSMDMTFTPQNSQTAVMKTLEELELKDRLRQRETSDRGGMG